MKAATMDFLGFFHDSVPVFTNKLENESKAHLLPVHVDAVVLGAKY